MTGASEALAAVLLAAVPSMWMQLHVGDPGPSGTANPAVESRRRQITWAPTSTAELRSSNPQVWAGCASDEDFTHWTGWTSSVSGTFQLSGLIASDAVMSGDTFTISAASTVVTFPIAT